MDNWKRVSTTSERLKEAMNNKKMKQSDLAKNTGLSKGGISNYVTGRYEPKSDIIQKLATALNVDEMWLWGYDVPMEKKDSPGEMPLTEGEKMVLDLFRKIPEDRQAAALDLLRAALKMQ